MNLPLLMTCLEKAFGFQPPEEPYDPLTDPMPVNGPEAVIGGASKIPLLKEIQDPMTYALSELNLALTPDHFAALPEDPQDVQWEQFNQFKDYLV